MSQRPPKITAVILNVGDNAALQDCLRSLDKAVYEHLNIVVVHNGPEAAGFETLVRASAARVSDVLFAGFNSGFAAGNNLGIKLALAKGADYVLLLNDDTVVAPDFLARLAARAEAEPAAGMFGPRIFYFSEPEKVWFSGARFDAEKCAFVTPGAGLTEADLAVAAPQASDYLTGCCLLVSREVIETAGLLDERFFLYWEDADWCFRARARGFRCLVVPDSRIWHKISLSSGGEDSPVKVYYKILGQLLFSDRYAPRVKSRLLAGFARDIVWLLLKSGAPDRWKKAWAYITAIADHYSGRRGR